MNMFQRPTPRSANVGGEREAVLWGILIMNMLQRLAPRSANEGGEREAVLLKVLIMNMLQRLAPRSLHKLLKRIADLFAIQTNGALAQLVERLHGMQEVRSSNLLCSTKTGLQSICEPFFESTSIPTARKSRAPHPVILHAPPRHHECSHPVILNDPPRHPELDSGSVDCKPRFRIESGMTGINEPRFLVKPGWRKKDELVSPSS